MTDMWIFFFFCSFFILENNCGIFNGKLGVKIYIKREVFI